MFTQDKNYVINKIKNGECYCEHYYVDSKKIAWEIIEEICPVISKYIIIKSRKWTQYKDPEDSDLGIIDDGESLEYWYLKDFVQGEDNLTYTVIHYLPN